MADKIDIEDFSKMKVAELKKVLKERGLPTSGSKSDLVDRLRESTVTEEVSMDQESSFFDDKLLESTTEGSAIEDGVLDEHVDLTETPPKQTETQQPATRVAVTAPVTAPVLDKVTSPDTEKDKVTTTALTPEQRMKQRAERFGVINEETKKQLRAQRFGEAAVGNNKLSTTGSGADVDALKKRAERFGQVLSSTLSKVDEAERLKKRKGRFGDVTTATNNSPKVAKLSVNVSSEEEEKRKKRAERFGMS